MPDFKTRYKNLLKKSMVDNFSILSIIFSIYLLSTYFLLNRIDFGEIILDNSAKFIIVYFLIIILIYVLYNIFLYFKKIIQSEKYDILTTYFFALIIIGFGKNIFIFLFLFFFYIFFLIFFNFFSAKKNISTKNKGILVTDFPIKKNENIDYLGFGKIAIDFAEIIYNNGSLDNQVFGLISEWGAGKSSFLKLLKEVPLIKEECIYIRFNPWYYESEKDLLGKFLENFASVLKDQGYLLPKLSKTLNKLLKVLDNNSSNMINFEVNFAKEQDLFSLKKNINDSLKEINKKIIIEIDDLDRIPSKKLKEIFKIVDLCKDFYNTSYILSYDPLNFNSIDQNLFQTFSCNNSVLDNQKNIEIIEQKIDNQELIKYMSKIINVYFPLVVDKEKLKNYFIRLFTFEKKDYFNTNSIKNIETGIEKLFELKNFNIWGKYYSNIRLIKRILNNLLVCNKDLKNGRINFFDEIEGVEFDIFVKFSILLMNYNDIFIDIDNESQLYNLSKNNKNSPKISHLKYILNSQNLQENKNYIDFINTLSTEKRKLLLDVFPIFTPQKNENIYKIRTGKILRKYLDVFKNNTSSIKNLIEINNIISDSINNYLSLKNIDSVDFQDIYKSIPTSGIDSFISHLSYAFQNEKNIVSRDKKIEKFLDYIIFEEKFYQEPFDNSLIFLIIRTLSFTQKTKNNFISEYMLGKNNYRGIINMIIHFTKGKETQLNGLYILVTLINFFDSKEVKYNFLTNLEKSLNKPYDKIKKIYCDELYIKLLENGYFDFELFSEIYLEEQKNEHSYITLGILNLIKNLSGNLRHILSRKLLDFFKKDSEILIEYLRVFLNEYKQIEINSIDLEITNIELNNFIELFGEEIKNVILKIDENKLNGEINLINDSGSNFHNLKKSKKIFIKKIKENFN